MITSTSTWRVVGWTTGHHLSTTRVLHQLKTAHRWSTTGASYGSCSKSQFQVPQPKCDRFHRISRRRTWHTLLMVLSQTTSQVQSTNPGFQSSTQCSGQMQHHSPTLVREYQCGNQKTTGPANATQKQPHKGNWAPGTPSGSCGPKPEFTENLRQPQGYGHAISSPRSCHIHRFGCKR